MRTVSATELGRNFRAILDSVEFRHEQYVVIRNNRKVARIIPSPVTLTALEAMADLYGTLSEEAAIDWRKDSRKKTTLSD